MLGLLTAASEAAVAGDTTLLGPNPDLVAGAEALQRGRFAEGIARTRAGLDAFVSADERASGLSNLCAGYIALRQYDVAIVHCSEALALNRGSWQAYNNRALAYLGKGMVRLARRDVRRGLALNPQAQRLLQVAALVEEAAGKGANAHDRDPIA